MTDEEKEIFRSQRLSRDRQRAEFGTISVDQSLDRGAAEGCSHGNLAGKCGASHLRKTDGLNYQNIVEGGKVFEEIIHHPIWFGMGRKPIENDYNKVSINECFLNIRGEGGFIGIHSGGHMTAFPGTFRSHARAWMVGQINILMALQDVGPGNGMTVVVPGSHKSHEIHPGLRPGIRTAQTRFIGRTSRTKPWERSRFR